MRLIMSLIGRDFKKMDADEIDRTVSLFREANNECNASGTFAVAWDLTGLTDKQIRRKLMVNLHDTCNKWAKGGGNEFDIVFTPAQLARFDWANAPRCLVERYNAMNVQPPQVFVQPSLKRKAEDALDAE